MGSSIAPKTFMRPGPLGQSQGSNAVTQIQPQAQAPYQGAPDFTAYGGQQAQPAPAPSQSPALFNGDDMQDRLRTFRGNLQRPFYGQMS